MQNAVQAVAQEKKVMCLLNKIAQSIDVHIFGHLDSDWLAQRMVITHLINEVN